MLYKLVSSDTGVVLKATNPFNPNETVDLIFETNANVTGIEGMSGSNGYLFVSLLMKLDDLNEEVKYPCIRLKAMSALASDGIWKVDLS